MLPSRRIVVAKSMNDTQARLAMNRMRILTFWVQCSFICFLSDAGPVIPGVNIPGVAHWLSTVTATRKEKDQNHKEHQTNFARDYFVQK